MPKSDRPYVICHMVPSVDGRIVTSAWKGPKNLHAAYEHTAESFGATAWMVGRVSMEAYAGKARIPKRKPGKPVPKGDFFAKTDATSYAITLDPSGKLRWQSSSLDGEHVVTVLTEQVSDDYLAFLRDAGVSYILGGRREVNLEKVLVTLRRELGIKKLLLEGGGRINGSFLAAGLIDELSMLVAPIADGGIGTPSLFDAKAGKGPARPLKLVAVERHPGDLLWLRYKVKP